MARWFDEEEQIWVDENDESWTPERAARHEAKTGGGDSGGGGGGGGGDSGGGGGGGGTSTSQGESLSGQDQATQDLFRNTWGSEAESRWAWEREQTYGATSSSNQAPDAGMQVAPEIQQAHDYYSRQRTSLAQQGQDVRMQPDPIQQINQQIEAYQPPPASEPPVPYGQGTPEQLASARTDRVASEAATTAAKSAVAAGATPEQAATTAATAATAAALALDNRSLVGESAETQRRFRDTYGPEQAPIIWARQHTADLELQNRLYGQYEPPPGTQPLAGIKAQPMPDRRIRDQEGAVQTGPATLAVPPPPPPAPAQPSVSHPAPAAGGGRPMQPQTQAEVAQLGAATGQTAPPATPEQAALQQDLADVPPAPTPIGQLVNADAPSELILRTALPQAVDQTGRINPAFREHALGEIAAGSAEGDRLLEPVARAAWYRQQAMQGQPEQPPEMAPAEYIDAWRGMWKSVGSGAPLMAALKAELHANQLSTPSEEAAWGRNEPDSIRPGVPDAAPAAPPASVPAAVAQSSDGIPPYQLGADLTDEQIIAGRRNLAARRAPSQEPEPVTIQLPHGGGVVNAQGVGVPHPSPPPVRDDYPTRPGATPPSTTPMPTDYDYGAGGWTQGQHGPAAPTAEPNIPQRYRPHWDEWLRAGGSGDWQQFREHAQRIGAGDPAWANALHQARQAEQGAQNTIREIGLTDQPNTALQAGADAWKTVQQGGQVYAAATEDELIHVAHGLSAGEAWAEPVLHSVARLAWASETGSDDPTQAPQDYLDTWIRSFRNGNVQVPRVAELTKQLNEMGIRMPWQRPGATSGAYDARKFFGDLTPAQVLGDECGPLAALGVARALGYDAPTNAVYRYAQQRGYHNGTEFTGPASMTRMLRDFGADANAPTGVDWNVVRAEVKAGRPVVLSSRGHYFLAQDVNDQGQFYVGNTGTALRGGSKWLSPQQMAALPGTRGGVNQMVTVNSLDRTGVQPPSFVQDIAPRQAAQQSVTMVTPVAGPLGTLAAIPAYDEPMVRTMQQRVLAEMPDIPVRQPGESNEAYMQKWAPALQWVEQEFGIPASHIGGLIMAENGFGVTNATRGNNYFSIEARPGEPTIPAGRWRQFASPKEALSRFLGLIAHPQNTYNTRGKAWANRRDHEAWMRELVKGGYIVEEPGFPISGWLGNQRKGRETWQRVTGT